MEKETVTLLIGAGIGFLASLLITIVSFIFQWIENNKKRKWEVEDRKKHKRYELINSRLNQIENEAFNLITWTNNIFLRYPQYNLNGISKEELSSIIPEYLNNSNLGPLAMILNDKILEEMVSKYWDYIQKFFYYIVEVTGSIDKLDLDKLSDIYVKIRTYYSLLLKQIDKYRIENLY